MTPVAHAGVDTPRRHVVLCTGVSSYGVLSYLSNDLARAFIAAGYTAEVLDLSRVAIPTELRRLVVEDRTAFCCGFSGYGANIQTSTGETAYDALGIPYVGLMLDNPTYYPARHLTASTQTIFLHGDDGHHDVSVAISPDGSHRGLFRLACAPWTAPLAPLALRSATAVFASKGGDPTAYEQLIRRTVDAAGVRLVFAVADALGAQAAPQRVWDVAWAHAPRGQEADARWHTLVTHADHLARIRRATAVARALGALPVTFVGGEWAHVAPQCTRATFLPGTPLPEVRRLMAASRVVLNVQPGTTDSIHDRFLLGLHAGAAVVSDSNRFIDDALGRDQFVCWDGDVATLADCVADTLRRAASGDAALQAMAARGTDAARAHFALDRLVHHLGAVVQAHRAGAALPDPDLTAALAA
ncbi:MAG: hypothetical protein LCH84_06780 [Gemmatimonadetes bacterium]|nr:hypothetical protein [Gemmatimonadota bacterium]